MDKESCKVDISRPPIPADCQTQGVRLVPFAREPAQPSPPMLVLYWRWLGRSRGRKRTTYVAPQHPDVSGQLNNHVRGISVCFGQDDMITSQPEGYRKNNNS